MPPSTRCATHSAADALFSPTGGRVHRSLTSVPHLITAPTRQQGQGRDSATPLPPAPTPTLEEGEVLEGREMGDPPLAKKLRLRLGRYRAGPHRSTRRSQAPQSTPRSDDTPPSNARAAGGGGEATLQPEHDDRPPVFRQGSREGGRNSIPSPPKPGRITLSELQTIISAIQGDPSFREDSVPFLTMGKGHYAPSGILDLIWEHPL